MRFSHPTSDLRGQPGRSFDAILDWPHEIGVKMNITA
jgi:hypothetical protein